LFSKETDVAGDLTMNDCIG